MPEPEVPAIVDTTTAAPGEVAEPAPEFEYVPAGHAEPFAEEPADHAPPPPPAQPAEGVAPAVDWNNPFG
jgi:hypothetical protein